MTPEQMRKVMPMTRYWAIQQGIKKGTSALFAPMVAFTQMVSDATAAAADTMQKFAFFGKK